MRCKLMLETFSFVVFIPPEPLLVPNFAILWKTIRQ